MSLVKSVKGRLIESIINSMNHDERDNGTILIGDDEPTERTVVYTCVFGGYDNIVRVPKTTRFDAVMIGDGNPTEVEGKGWDILKKKIKKIPDEPGSSNILQNRYFKMHPAELFKERYKFAIYVDGNVEVKAGVAGLAKIAAESKTGLALHRHQFRDSAYDEAKACILLKKGKSKELKKQVKRYKTDGFPKNFGLYECNMIIVDLQNDNAEIIMNAWWREFLESGSMRDQIALPYVVWKLGYKFDDVGNLGNNIYKDPLVKVKKHAGGTR